MAAVDHDMGVAVHTACRAAPGAGGDIRAGLDGIVARAAAEDVAVEAVTVGGVGAAAVGRLGVTVVIITVVFGVGIIDSGKSPFTLCPLPCM